MSVASSIGKYFLKNSVQPYGTKQTEEDHLCIALQNIENLKAEVSCSLNSIDNSPRTLEPELVHNEMKVSQAKNLIDNLDTISTSIKEVLKQSHKRMNLHYGSREKNAKMNFEELDIPRTEGNVKKSERLSDEMTTCAESPVDSINSSSDDNKRFYRMRIRSSLDSTQEISVVRQSNETDESCPYIEGQVDNDDDVEEEEDDDDDDDDDIDFGLVHVEDDVNSPR